MAEQISCCLLGVAVVCGVSRKWTIGGGGASVGPMLLTLEGALVMARAIGGWVGAALIGAHNPWASWERFGSL